MDYGLCVDDPELPGAPSGQSRLLPGTLLKARPRLLGPETVRLRLPSGFERRGADNQYYHSPPNPYYGWRHLLPQVE
jgi:hypothetical protein